MLPTSSRSVVGWPAGFLPLDLQLADGCPAPEDNAGARFTFLDDCRDLGDPIRWDAPGASRLWKYHLHYLEWAWSFASHPNRVWARRAFADLWQSWARAAPFGRGDEWSPYVASMRAWALCGSHAALVAGSEIEGDVDASLDRHARFLRWHLEYDVGGNHLLKNLKALIGLGVFLGDEKVLDMALGSLQRQISIQVLPDGGHYERSPSYHCQVLGDFIDIAGLLAAVGRQSVPGLDRAIAAMRVWLGLMILPDGDVPIFNDCVLVGSQRLALLGPGPPATKPLTVLDASGYVVMRTGDRLHLVADVGDPCPPDLPAHAHADCLSFELSVDGERFVVDSGTTTYEPGAKRSFERSTAAHNTVMIDGADQTEVWGTFRAARLARGRLERADHHGSSVTVTASHDGYLRLPGRPLHRRTWELVPEQVTITDTVSGGGTHTIASRLLFTRNRDVAAVSWSGPDDLVTIQDDASYAQRFGAVRDGTGSMATWQGPLPVVLQTQIELKAASPATQSNSASRTGN